MAITRAYIRVSTDPIIGTDQKGATFYKRIYDSYVPRKPLSAVVRPFTSVETRVKQLLKECVRFSACFKSVKDMKRSGYTEDDEFWVATALFNNRKVDHPREDVGKPFRFLECWSVLRELPKFAATSDKSESTSDE